MMNIKKVDLLLIMLLMALVFFCFGGIFGDAITQKMFINGHFKSEFVVLEKTIRTNGEFSYVLADGIRRYDLHTKDNLEMNDIITIGPKN